MVKDDGAQMFTTLALMFGAALACGFAPFFLRVREAHLQTLAALGAGLLVGSALAVIIPEGFHAFGQAAHAHIEHDHDHEHVHEHEGGLPEGVAGLVLVAGFLAMLLLDHLQHAAGGTCSAPGHAHHHGHNHRHGRSESAGSHERLRERSPKKDKVTTVTDPQSAITGLLIHCAADGLAMGAAFLSGNARLSMLIAAAMVLHKAPMAFGLATYLIACQWSFQRSQRTLVLFAAAAPAATLATYWLLGSLTVLSSPAAVALCLIFSGGTFLHAATMHILPEVLHSGPGGRMSAAQLAAVAGGSLLPVLLSWGHEH